MKEKCEKFKSLYLFGQENELEEHIKNCPDCKSEKQKMDRVSELIQEAKPYYAHRQKVSYIRLKVACLLCFGLFVGTLIGYFTQYNYYTTSMNNSTNSEYSISSSTTNEYGIPVDSYGLITVN